MLNGRIGQDKEGGFTCLMPNGGKSTIDYMLCSTPLFTAIKEFCIQYKDIACTGMSHFPLTLSLKCKKQNQIDIEYEKDILKERTGETYVKLKWSKEFEGVFRDNMNSNFTESKWQEFDTLLERGKA